MLDPRTAVYPQVGAPVSVLATGYAYKIIAEAKALKVQWTGKASSAASEFSSQISEVRTALEDRATQCFLCCLTQHKNFLE